MAKNKYTSKYRMQIVSDLVKRSYVANSELKTRVNLLENIVELKERAKNDEKEFLFLDDIKNELFSYPFNILDDIYHDSFYASDDEIEASDNQPLLKLLMTAKKNQKIELYFEGKKQLAYKFIKRLLFEDKLYVVLKDGDNTLYYCYTFENDKEKIAPVNDGNLLRFLAQISKD